MRRLKVALPISFVFIVGACQGTTVPESRELLGSWLSSDFADAVIRMTLTETVRAVDGAGAWETPVGGRAFRVSGAIAGDEVSLYLDFEADPDVNFQGVFSDEDNLEGFLSGGVYRRRSINFTREDLLPGD